MNIQQVRQEYYNLVINALKPTNLITDENIFFENEQIQEDIQGPFVVAIKEENGFKRLTSGPEPLVQFFGKFYVKIYTQEQPGRINSITNAMSVNDQLAQAVRDAFFNHNINTNTDLVIDGALQKRSHNSPPLFISDVIADYNYHQEILNPAM